MGWNGMDFGRYWTSTTGVGYCTGYPGLLVSPRSKDCSHPNLSPRHLQTFVTYSPPGAALQIYLSHFEPPQPPKCNGYCKTRTLCSQVIKGAPAQSSSDIHFWNSFLLNTPTCVHVLLCVTLNLLLSISLRTSSPAHHQLTRNLKQTFKHLQIHCYTASQHVNTLNMSSVLFPNCAD